MQSAAEPGYVVYASQTDDIAGLFGSGEKTRLRAQIESLEKQNKSLEYQITVLTNEQSRWYNAYVETNKDLLKATDVAILWHNKYIKIHQENMLKNKQLQKTKEQFEDMKHEVEELRETNKQLEGNASLTIREAEYYKSRCEKRGDDENFLQLVEEALRILSYWYDDKDFYLVLNVSTEATTKEIQKAALKLSRKFHSDKFAQLYEKGMIDLDADLFKTVFNIVFAARDCLVNETKLKKYLQDKESDTVKHDYSHYGKKFTSKCNK